MVNFPPTVLNADQLIRLVHDTQLFFNPEIPEAADRLRAQYILRKGAQQISPTNRCIVYTKHRFGPFRGGNNNVADPLPGDVSPNAGEHYLPCDAVLYYACLPDYINLEEGVPPPSPAYPRVPLILVAVGRNVNPELVGGEQLAGLAELLGDARDRPGEQAGFMFGDPQFQHQPNVIGMAMAAEAWSYTRFHRSEKPAEFDARPEWKIPAIQWSQPHLWGTSESDDAFNQMLNDGVRLLDQMEIPAI